MRTIKKYGNTWVIFLYKADVEDFHLEIGDKVDISELIKEVKKNDE